MTHGPPCHVPPCQEVSIHRAALGPPHGLKEHCKNQQILFFYDSNPRWILMQPFTFCTYPESNSQDQQKIDHQHHNINRSQCSHDTRGGRGSGGHAGHLVGFHFVQSVPNSEESTIMRFDFFLLLLLSSDSQYVAKGNHDGSLSAARRASFHPLEV